MYLSYLFCHEFCFVKSSSLPGCPGRQRNEGMRGPPNPYISAAKGGRGQER